MKKLILCALFAFTMPTHPALAATIREPGKVDAAKLPRWIYIEDLSTIQKSDAIVYKTNDSESAPWYTALVYDVDHHKDKTQVIVMRPMSDGVSVFEVVDRKNILSAAREVKGTGI